MTNVFRLDGLPAEEAEPSTAGISALRLMTGMDVDEFASAVGKELGWPVPLFVYLEWEKDGADAAPSQALQAARNVALRNPIGARTLELNRRRFLGGVVGFSTLAAAGFPMRSRSLNIAGLGRTRRVSTETADDLEALVSSYRQAYAGTTSAADLLRGATGLMHLLMDLERHDQWPGGRDRLASLVGQTALLAGLLNLMGTRDLNAAKSFYNLGLQSAREAEDWDLASYVLGSLAFEAVIARRPADGQAIMEATWDLASRHANPRTQAWAAALASELHARAGQEVASRRSLERAYAALERTRQEPSWKGVGWFDEAKLLSYDGGNLLLLGKHSAAEERLRRSLKRLDPVRLKHRCTASADLAMVLALRDEIDESCARATEALALATAISHRESVDRVRGVHFRLLPWRTHPAVVQLAEQLEAA